MPKNGGAFHDMTRRSGHIQAPSSPLILTESIKQTTADGARSSNVKSPTGEWREPCDTFSVYQPILLYEHLRRRMSLTAERQAIFHNASIDTAHHNVPFHVLLIKNLIDTIQFAPNRYSTGDGNHRHPFFVSSFIRMNTGATTSSVQEGAVHSTHINSCHCYRHK